MGNESEVPAPADARVERFPDAVILPGLINAHTHLELHGLRGQIEDDDFFQWIQHVRRAKQAIDETEFLHAARDGVRDAWRYGITYLCDTGTSGASVRALEEIGAAGVYYHEVIAPDPTEEPGAMRALEASVERLKPRSNRLGLGVSPHAPYTVSPELMRTMTRWARARAIPLAGHVAESRGESDFVTEGSGPFATLWRERGIPFPRAAASPVAYLERLGVLGADFLAIHAVQTDQTDHRIFAETGTRVVACPRSNARHGHGTPDLQGLRSAGVPVALGTDSVASVESVDILAEARAAMRLCGMSALESLGLVTWEARHVVAADVGALVVGNWGDFIVVETEPTRDPEELAGNILEQGEGSVRQTFLGGRCVYRC